MWKWEGSTEELAEKHCISPEASFVASVSTYNVEIKPDNKVGGGSMRMDTSRNQSNKQHQRIQGTGTGISQRKKRSSMYRRVGAYMPLENVNGFTVEQLPSFQNSEGGWSLHISALWGHHHCSVGYINGIQPKHSHY